MTEAYDRTGILIDRFAAMIASAVLNGMEITSPKHRCKTNNQSKIQTESEIKNTKKKRMTIIPGLHFHGKKNKKLKQFIDVHEKYYRKIITEEQSSIISKPALDTLLM